MKVTDAPVRSAEAQVRGEQVDASGPFAGALGRWFAVAVAGTLTVAIVLRFVTKSDLWLDEALTVNIARRPLSDLNALLRHDGAPPLYYVLLHLWMRVFDTSDLGARSLSGVVGVATLPVAWLAGRRLGGPSEAGRAWVGWGAVVVVASSPFAIRYSTEARMYELEILLVLLGYLALWRALERPSVRRLAAVAIVAAALLYTQYWAIYLLVVVGAGLAWCAWRGAERAAARRALVALGVGGVTFVPWLPAFLYQLLHTGTPWADPQAPPTGMFKGLVDFAGGDHVEGYTLILPLTVLAFLALFGRAVDARHVDLDLRTRPGARWEWYAAAGTLVVGLTLSFAGRSAFQPRYASIMFGLFALLVAYGITAFAAPGLRYAALAVVVGVGLVGGARNVVVNRTQAGEVAGAIAAHSRPGDLVAYCPDQVGPDTARLLTAGLGLRQLTFPTLKGPDLVDWVDYGDRNRSADPKAFARAIARRAGIGHDVWLVWSSGYRTLGKKCETIVTELDAVRPRHHVVVEPNVRLFEPQGLVRYQR